MMNGGRALNTAKYIFDPSLAGVARHVMKFKIDFIFDNTWTESYVMFLARQQDRVIVTRSVKLINRLKYEKERSGNVKVKLEKLKGKLETYKGSCDVVDEDTVEIMQDEIDTMEEDINNEYEYKYYLVKSLGRKEQLEEVLTEFGVITDENQTTHLTCLHCSSVVGTTAANKAATDLVCSICGGLIRNGYMFKHKIVRHMYWILSSPTVLSSSIYSNQLVSDEKCSQFLSDSLQWLHDLDSDPSDLKNFVVKKHGRGSTRLGNYFASLIEYFIANRIPNAKSMVYRDVQVRDPTQRTIGDMDVVFRDENNDWTHWEVGIKFYLLSEDPSDESSGGLNQFVGPHGHGDTLHKKLTKGVDYTLGLPDMVRNDTNSYTLYPPIPLEHVPVKSYLFVKGIMFYPYMGWNRDKIRQQFNSLNPEHLQGWWSRFNPSDLNANPFLSDCQHMDNIRFKILDKEDYMSEYFQFSEDSLYASHDFFTLLQTYFEHQNRSIMVVKLQKGEIPESAWTETSRGFIVHSSWLESNNKHL